MRAFTSSPLLLCLFLILSTSARSANAGDFRTKSGGNWNQSAIWEYYNGSAWVNASWAPTLNDNAIDVRSGHAVAVTANLSIDQTDVTGTLSVNSGVILTINDGSSTDLAISNTVTVYGTLVNQGTISGIAAELIFANGSVYRHNKDGGALPDATWNDGSTCEITGIVSSTSITNTDQSFYHFKWNCTSQTAETNCAGNLQTIRGNFIMVGTGASGRLKLAETADYTLTISGNWDHQGGTLNMGGGSSYALINLYGNFSMTGGKITEYNSSAYTSRIVFLKAGTQTWSKTAGSIENSIDFEIASGATLDVGNSIVDGSLGQFSVSSGSTLKTAHLDGISASGASGCIQTTSRYFSFAANYQYYRTGTQATGTGLPTSLNGKLLIGSVSGATNLTITSGTMTVNGTLILTSSAVANSSIASGTILYGSNGILEYQGLSLQTTGVREWPSSGAPNYVNVNNPSGVNLDFDRTVSGTLTLSQGSFSIGPHVLTLTGQLVSASGTLTGGATSDVTIGGTSGTPIDLPSVSLRNLYLSRPGGLRLNGNVTVGGTVTMNNGQVTLLPSKVLSYQPGSRLNYNGSANQSTSAEEFPPTGGPPALEVDKPSGTSLSLTFSRTLEENLWLTSGIFSIGTNQLSLNGQIVKNVGQLSGSSGSVIIVGGTAASLTLPAVTLGYLTLDRPNGMALADNIEILNSFTIRRGSIVRNGFTMYGPAAQLRYLGTDPQVSSDEELPVTAGPFSIETGNPAGVTLHADRTLAGTLTLTTGFFSIVGRTLTMQGMIVASGGTLQASGTGNLVVNESGTAFLVPEADLNNLTINRSPGAIINATCTVRGTLTLDNGYLTVSNGRTLRLYGQPIAGTPENLVTTGGSILDFGGSQPGVVIPSSVVFLGNLIINNPNGVTFSHDMNISGSVMMKGAVIMGSWQLSGTAMFNAQGGARLVTAHPDGLTGSIQLSGPVVVSGSCDYEFNGSTDQLTNFLPTSPTGTLRNLTVCNSNPANLTLVDDMTVTGNLSIKPGSTFTISPANCLTVSGDATIE